MGHEIPRYVFCQEKWGKPNSVPKGIKGVRSGYRNDALILVWHSRKILGARSQSCEPDLPQKNSEDLCPCSHFPLKPSYICFPVLAHRYGKKGRCWGSSLVQKCQRKKGTAPWDYCHHSGYSQVWHKVVVFGLLFIFASIRVMPEGLIPRGGNTNSVEKGKQMPKWEREVWSAACCSNPFWAINLLSPILTNCLNLTLMKYNII